MNLYRETQIGWLLIVPALAMFLYITWLYAFQIGSRPVSIGSYFMANGILALITLLMYRMRTEVTNGGLTITFGVGLIKRIVPASEIEQVNEVTNKWYYGWGIRLVQNGWLYNMSGLKGVELTLLSGRVVRVGSADPAALASAINKILKVPR